jgi:hypothetical protein
MIKPKFDNATKNESPTSSAIRTEMHGELLRKVAVGRARVEAAQLPAGPTFTASTAPVEPHRKPVVVRRG